MKLYELSAEIRNLQAMLTAEETDSENAQAIADTLEGVQGEFTEKAIGIGCLIKEMTADNTAIDEEVKRLTAMKKRNANAVDYLKTYLLTEMKEMGKDMIQNVRCTLSTRLSPPAVQVVNEEEFIEWAKSNRPDVLRFYEPEINKTELQKVIKSGEAIEGVELVRAERLVIR